MTDAAAVTLQASTTPTGVPPITGSSTAVDLGDYRRGLRIALDVTAVSGTTPALIVVVETSPTSTGPWTTAYTFDGQNAIAHVEAAVADLKQWVRISYTITGLTPSFTFSVAGFAHSLFCHPSDLSKTSINSSAIAGIDSAVLVEACFRATDDAVSALNAAYELPIVAWDNELTGVCADRAAFYAMAQRGFDPGDTDRLLMMNGGKIIENGVRSAAEKWFSDVGRGVRKPPGIVDSTPDEYEAAAAVVSAGTSRGWHP